MPNAFFQECRKLRPTSLEEFHILRSIPENVFREILFLASEACNTSAAALIITENEENYIKAAKDVDPDWLLTQEKVLKASLQQEETFVISDLLSDAVKFSFYAGTTMVTASGDVLGILCVLDPEKNELKPNEERSLLLLAGQVLKLVEFKKQENQSGRMQAALEQKYQDLERFASVVSHDIKSPLANIISLTELLKEENKGNLSAETMEYLDFLEESSQSLRRYVDGLLKFYRSEKLLEKKEEDVELGSFFEEVAGLYNVDADVEINYPKNGILQNVNKAALSQIFLNLLANALKYNHKPRRQVVVLYKASETFYEFEVNDNGEGIPEENIGKIFDLFTTLEQNDRYGNMGNGIGLATVKKLIDHMGGEISVESTEGEGSSFKFKIKR
ncbi:GAF domain-containing sensor histidine kinase [Salinimicrobium catena]|uniref:sensor histidine kinase n=1 Tax=Salinimicrobium catena TaxID=390640 RepID=UPI002FE46E5D